MRSFALALLLSACGPVDLGGPSGTSAWVGVLVAPARVVVPVGGEAPLAATGLTAARTAADVTDLARWEVEDAGVAEVSEALDAEGTLRGVSAGRTRVRAVVQGVPSPWVDVDVTEAEVRALAVTPAVLDLAVGGSAPLKATATYSDGLSADASRQVRWVVEDGVVATVDASGLVTGMSEGTTQIAARWDDIGTPPTTINVRRGAAQLRVASVARTTNGVRVEVANVGSVAVDATWLDVYVAPARPPVAGDLGDAFVRVENLAPGETRSVALVVNLPAGQPEVTAFVDSLDTLEEADESDNLLTVRLGSTSDDVLPDLAIYDVTSSVYATFIVHTVTVANLADAPSGPFDLETWGDRVSAPGPRTVADDVTTVDGLGPFETRSINVLVSVSCSTCSAWFWVDRADVVVESDAYENLDGPYVTAPAGDSGFETGWW
jgi:hypothetical protein